MIALFRAFWLIAILKMAPQAIPPSRVLLVLMVFPTSRVQAQESELTLRLRRTFGYQAGQEIQGSFTLENTEIAEDHPDFRIIWIRAE